MYEFDTLLSYFIHLVVHQVAIDESSDNTPTGSDWTRSYPAVITNPNLTNLTPVHVSKTVTIENLNPNSTEDDVRNLCQMFGSVQVKMMLKFCFDSGN